MMHAPSEWTGARPSIAGLPLQHASPADLIFGWDLSPVIRRTAARMGWSPLYAAEVEQEYRRFLYVSVAHPNETLGMAGPVDEAWHDHILDTVDYVEFCRQASGRYLHHTLRGEAVGSGSEYARTLALLEQHFGKPNWRVWPRAGASKTQCCSNCTHITIEHEALLDS